jgi:large subunit ribosomal protein L17
MARRVVRDRGAVLKLFDELAPRYIARRGGFSRFVKLVERPGDAAPMSLLELIPDEGAPSAAKEPKETAAEAKGKGGKAAKAEAAPAEKAAKGGGKKAAPSDEKAAAKKPAKPAKSK